MNSLGHDHTVSTTALSAEWERLYLLAVAAETARSGAPLGPDHLDRLRDAHSQVLAGREQYPWQPISSDLGLSSLDQDIAACALAPEAEPRLGWLFRELQSGSGAHFPTPALVRELFALEGIGLLELDRRLQRNAPLMQNGLIEWTRVDTYEPLRPTASLQSRLLGRGSVELHVPGALQIQPQARLSDLVLPDECMRRLRQLLSWVIHRDKVQALGLRVGGGPVALLSGPSGTGKTFAAEAVACELGNPLYLVDLGLLVSKYIGETERNLDALFDAAARADGVLLFDEADSLFGKRGEVKEARDRYANMEVSHLLTRIERHRGLCILTSNLRQHIDAAFTRRLQFIVEFPRPDAQGRQELWRRYLPCAAVSEEVDIAMLAAAPELTGAQIQSVALHAAFMAADDGNRIYYRHLAEALQQELEKQRPEVLPSSLGGLAKYVKRGESA